MTTWKLILILLVALVLHGGGIILIAYKVGLWSAVGFDLAISVAAVGLFYSASRDAKE